MDMVQWARGAFYVASVEVILTCAGCSGSNGTNGFEPARSTTNTTTVPAIDERTSSAAPRYSPLALPHAFTPVAIMPDGVIAGSEGNQAAQYSNGRITLLGHYTGFENNTVATSVNDRGDAVGYAIAQPYFLGSPTVALFFHLGHLTVLQGASSETIDSATSLNDNNKIVGTCTDPTSENMGFIPNLCTFKLGGIGSVIGSGTVGNINSRGEYVGSFNDYNNNNMMNLFFAFFGNGVTTTDIFPTRVVGNNILQNTASWVNNLGSIVGSTQQVTTPNTTNAYIIKAGHLSLITVPRVACTNATGINSSNQVVGNAGVSSIAGENDTFTCAGSGFLWESGHLYNLNALVPGSSLGLNNAIGIDDRGDILASSANKTYLLRP